VAIREESGLSRAAHLKRLMGAFFLALVLILTGACGGGEKKEDEKKKEETKKAEKDKKEDTKKDEKKEDTKK
jgi:hypothetical protein